MPESENRAPQSVYDREAEFPHDETRSGRRRRPVADWGGDELFTRMPRRRSGHMLGQRRFARPADAPPGVDLEPEGIWAASHGVPRPAEDVWAASHGVPGEAEDVWASPHDLSREPEDIWAHPRGEPRGPQDDWGVGRPGNGEPDGDWAREPEHSGAAHARPPAAADAPEPALGPDDDPSGVRPALPPAASGRSAGGVRGRRTVVIGRTGRPVHQHPDAPFASVSRRRPPRTVAERIGGRPERIVAWAFALGLILILIAIATAHA